MLPATLQDYSIISSLTAGEYLHSTIEVRPSPPPPPRRLAPVPVVTLQAGFGFRVRSLSCQAAYAADDEEVVKRRAETAKLEDELDELKTCVGSGDW